MYKVFLRVCADRESKMGPFTCKLEAVVSCGAVYYAAEGGINVLSLLIKV